MSHTHIANCSDSSKKEDDTLIIIVNSDGTLSVDPETLQKLLANQHHNSPISLVRLDAKNVGGDDGDEEDDDPDSRVNLTVEGYYPPTPAPSSPTPPPTPVPDTSISADGGEPDVLADSIILQPEDVEKLETALQSEHAKEILGDVVLDMLQESTIAEGTVTQPQSIVLDHCYASLSAPTTQSPTTPSVVVSSQPVSTRGTGRGRGMKAGRGRGGLLQTKATLQPGASMVPVVEQLVTVTSGMRNSVGTTNSIIKHQATVPLQRVDLHQVLPSNLVPCTVKLNKVPVQSSSVIVTSLPVGGGDVKTLEAEAVTPKKKSGGRGRGLSTRGRGTTSTRGRGQGKGRVPPKLSVDAAKNKELAEEMAATVRALTIAEAEQFAQIESMDQSTNDADRVIPLVNKVPVKKPVKVYRRVLESSPKSSKPKAPKKLVLPEPSKNYDNIVADQNKTEKVIVVSMEPQITPAVVSAVVMSQNQPSPTIPPAPIPTPAISNAAPSHRKNYPKRENRKPPAHLAEAFGPALFSTPDIIRRVSTDKPATPTTPAPSTPTPQIITPVTPVTQTPEEAPTTSKMEDELDLTDSVVEQDSIMETITSQVTKQEDQLLAEALLLEELGALPTDDMLQDEAPPPSQQAETVVLTPSTPKTVKKPSQKNLSQTSLSTFFPKINQTKDELKIESVETPLVTPQVLSPGLRKLPPVELPATRGATKRASLQKDQVQDDQIKKQDTAKKTIATIEKRKSTDSKKSTESRKSAGRSISHGEDSEDMLVSDDVSDEEGSYNSEDDPNRLWCICKRPHNNRFMICCDFCEDWFHGKCVGITKAMGEQMEEQEIEWMCPNCKKKKKQEEVAKKQAEGKAVSTPSPKKTQIQTEVVDDTPPNLKEKKAESSKVMVQHQKLVVLGQDTTKSAKGNEIRITKVSAKKSTDDVRKSVEEAKEMLVVVQEAVEHVNPETSKEMASTAVADSNSASIEPANVPGMECIVCKKGALSGGVYCSDECIAKHTHDSLNMIDKSAVIVFERKTGRIYTGPNAPTPSTLTSWLMAHPSYEVMRPGVLPSAKYYNQQKSPNQPRPPQALLKQTVLQTRPQGIQLIAALPQPPPIEGPLKKNLAKPDPPSPIPRIKPQAIVKGQQQITALLKVQHPKQEVTDQKSLPTKNVVSPPSLPVIKKPVKEMKKTPQQPVFKKTTPTQTKKTTKEEAKPEQKKEEPRSRDQEELNVRASVKKTLQEVLITRLQEVSDIKLTEEQIKKIAIHIEEELYILFKDTNTKYKAKYRSLMFNIKDKNNLTLFRKIADKSISPVQLVRLTPEELASQELAQWREREARHQLEMIKKTELDLMQQAKTVVMKTHKGEQVVENEDGLGGKVLETSVEIEPVLNVSTSVTPTIDVPTAKPKDDLIKIKEDKHVKKQKKEEKHKERRHSHKSSHHKDHDRGRSRHRSSSNHRSRSKSKHRIESKPKSRSGSPEESAKIKDKTDIKTKERDRSKSRSERSRSRHHFEERERSHSRPRERSKSRPRERSMSRPREGSKIRLNERGSSKNRSRSKNRLVETESKSQTRSRSKSRPRERSLSQPGKANSSDVEETTVAAIEEKGPQDVNIENDHENIVDIPSLQPTIFDDEIKEIIHDVVVEEEIGQDAEDDLSDREPSSTVNISTPPFNAFEEEEPIKPPVWRGTLLMPDVAKFSTSIQEVSGVCGDLEYDLPDIIDCVGRISPETAWDYIAKMKKSGTKQILVVRFSADNEEDKMSYLSFYSYLSSRNRLGVVGNNSKMIKDFYILPLASHSPVPQVLLPLDGPGFEDYRPHLLLGIIVRTKRKRHLTDREPPYVSKVAKKSERSYTPPLPDEDSHTPTQQHQQPATESFTPPHSPKPPRIIKLKPRTSKTADSPTMSEDFVLEGGDTPYTPEDEEDADAPYSPGEGEGASDDAHVRSPGCSAELQRKVDELNRMINDIEEKKQKIDSLGAIAGMSPPQEIMVGTQEEDEEEEEIEEAYSPSGSITPPATDSSYLDKSSSRISLPTDLQEIIASIKKKPDEPKSMDLKSDPIVQAYRTTEEPYSPEEDKVESEPGVEEKVPTPNSEANLSNLSLIKSTSASVKVNRDPRQRSAQLSLSQLSDEEIMKKASEMGFMNPENPEPIPDTLKSRSASDPAGLDESYDPFSADTDRSKTSSFPPSSMPIYMNQSYPSSQAFNPDFPPPPRPPNFPPPTQFQAPHLYQPPPPPPMPPLPPSHIPFTNPQPPPPQPMYPPPPPPQPAPLPPPPPSNSPELISTKKKFSKKSKKKSRDPRNHKEKKEKRKYSESPPLKDYDYDESKFDKIRDRERYSSKKRDKKDSWRGYDKPPLPEKRRDCYEYEIPPPTLPPPQGMPGPPHPFGIPGPMRGGPIRGRYIRGMRGGFRRGFDRPPMRGFHRGGFHQRGQYQGPPSSSTSRNFQPKNIQNEFEEDIRRFEEQRLKQKNLERRKWRNESPPPSRKRRVKDGDSD